MNAFWQRPKEAHTVTDLDNVWYDKMAVGKNTLGSLMANLSEECGLSKRYTNHCIRSTCITVLDDNDIASRHIIGLSGHKSETSIKSYSKRLNDDKKRQMSGILSENIVGTESSSTVGSTASVDFLDSDVEFDAILRDINNFETNSVQQNVQANTVNTENVPPAYFPIPFRAGFSIGQIANSNIHFHFGK